MAKFEPGEDEQLGRVRDHVEGYGGDEWPSDLSTEPDDVIQTECDNCKLVLGIDPSLYLKDGKRRIDFVLVWKTPKNDGKRMENDHKRKIFEMNLEKDDLVLEREEVKNKLNFVKIHAPVKVLKEFTEILQFRMPLKEEVQKDDHEKTKVNTSTWNTFMNKFRVDSKLLPHAKYKLTDIYSQEKEYLFDVGNRCFWKPAVRSRIVQFMLDLTETQEDNDKEFGITRLISNDTDAIYCAAYPLHDGDLKPDSMRFRLLTEWASMSKWFKNQPLDCIKDYFGVKVGLYFAWLGFYTHMLVPASLVGLICFVYSAATEYINEPSKDVCNSSVKMCPICDYFCEYWDLKDTCLKSRLTYIIDNPATLFFAFFMSVWVAMFLVKWKRYSANLTHHWDLTGFDEYEEHPRSQFLQRETLLKDKSKNSFWMRRKPVIISRSVVSFLVVVEVAVLVAKEVYNISLLCVTILRHGNNALITPNPDLLTSSIAAFVNYVLMELLSEYIYKPLAKELTDQEYLRTQTEYEDSLTLKVYVLEFINCYGSLFYIAFFKGKFSGWPGKYYRIFGRRQEECATGGCLLELSMQLAIIMVNREVKKTLQVRLWKWWKTRKTHILKLINRLLRRVENSSTLGEEGKPLRYVEDFNLSDFDYHALFSEYLDQVLQFGFVTIFAAAFPLAPLCALIKNVFEIRLDAKKFLTEFRRPVPRRVTDIGIWYSIMESVGRLSIITNALIIAFTSELIPRMVYNFLDGKLDDYVNSTLVQFNMSVLEHPPMGSVIQQNDTCSVSVYYNYMPHNEDCKHSNLYWHVMVARFAFVVVFENLVSLVVIIVYGVIPDMPSKLRAQIREEARQIKKVYRKHRAEKKLKAPQDSQQRGCQDGGKKDSNATIDHGRVSCLEALNEYCGDFTAASSLVGRLQQPCRTTQAALVDIASIVTYDLSLEEYHVLRDVRVHLAKPESYFELEEYTKPDYLDLTSNVLENERTESPDDKSPLIDNTSV